MPKKTKAHTSMHLIDTYIDFEESVELARVNSPCQTIVVLDYAGHRFMHIDSVAIQSAMSLQLPHVIVLEAIQYLLGIVLFYKEAPQRCLIAGVGGGSLVRFLRYHFPSVTIDCVDMDAAMFQIAERYFGLPKADDSTQYIVDDAFIAIERFAKDKAYHQVYDSLLINIDYGDNTPRQFFTKAFYQRCLYLLSLDGILAINLIVEERNILREILQVIRSVFKGRCLCFEVPGHYNVMIYAFKRRPMDDLSFKEMTAKAKICQDQFEIDTPAIWRLIRKTTPSIAPSGQKHRLSHIIP